MMMAWLIVVDQWLETATEILCVVFWAIAGAMAVVGLVRLFMGTLHRNDGGPVSGFPGRNQPH